MKLSLPLVIEVYAGIAIAGAGATYIIVNNTQCYKAQIDNDRKNYKIIGSSKYGSGKA